MLNSGKQARCIKIESKQPQSPPLDLQTTKSRKLHKEKYVHRSSVPPFGLGATSWPSDRFEAQGFPFMGGFAQKRNAAQGFNSKTNFRPTIYLSEVRVTSPSPIPSPLYSSPSNYWTKPLYGSQPALCKHFCTKTSSHWELKCLAMRNSYILFVWQFRICIISLIKTIAQICFWFDWG